MMTNRYYYWTANEDWQSYDLALEDHFHSVESAEEALKAAWYNADHGDEFVIINQNKEIVSRLQYWVNDWRTSQPTTIVIWWVTVYTRHGISTDVFTNEQEALAWVLPYFTDDVDEWLPKFQTLSDLLDYDNETYLADNDDDEDVETFRPDSLESWEWGSKDITL